jgi:hypothetical protein
MESFNDSRIMHRDHEPAGCDAARGATRRSAPCSTTLRFMESPHSIFRMHWDHEPRILRCSAFVRPADLEIGDTAGLETCATVYGEESANEPASARRQRAATGNA